MDITAIDALFTDLKKTAAALLEKSSEERKKLKAELDEYAATIRSQMAGKAKEMAENEFAKCRRSGKEWIMVYCDPSYHEAIKADILKEEVIEFFFTMEEKIVAVQKKFFVQAMVDELLQPSQPFSEKQQRAKITFSRIKILAREQGLKASWQSKSVPNTEEEESNERLWFFGDEQNFLQSSDAGLSDEEALDYLLN